VAAGPGRQGGERSGGGTLGKVWPEGEGQVPLSGITPAQGLSRGLTHLVQGVLQMQASIGRRADRDEHTHPAILPHGGTRWGRPRPLKAAVARSPAPTATPG